MALDTRNTNNSVDAISMVANQMKIDLSATIKPQDKIDVTKNFDVEQHASSVGASLQETVGKVGEMTKIEQALHQSLQAGGPEQIVVGDLGQKRPGGLSRGAAIAGMGALGLLSPAAAAGMALYEGVKFVMDPVPGVHMHAAEAPAPSSFKDPVGKSSSNKDAEPSVYGDAMGGQWNFRTGFEVTNTPAPKPGTPTQYDRDMQKAAQNTIGILGADAVREDLGQIGEAKKRLGQQGQEALDQAEKVYGIKPEQKYAILPPTGAVSGGPRGPFG